MLLNPYKDMRELQEEPTDVYISSSWLDNGHWMWDIVDGAFKDMMKDKNAILLAFDESITLKHNIKTMKQLQRENKKQDPLTWRIEFLNERVKENTSAFFTYTMLIQNQTLKKPFYPRKLVDVKTHKKNPHSMQKQNGEIRIVSCDMAFITKKGNDNSIFTCMRLLPESRIYDTESPDRGRIEVKKGYRRVVSYLESHQGGDTDMQAVRIRQLYEDFDADYIVLDIRNAGISIYDKLAKVMYDEDRDCEYSPLSCMNNNDLANRIKIEGSTPVIFAISASQKLNSDIAYSFREVLDEKKIDFLVNLNVAKEDILINYKDYIDDADVQSQLLYEKPFLETQLLISETSELVYEKKEQTGVIVVSEQGSNTKDRYTSCSYGSYFASLLEQDLLSDQQEEDPTQYSACVSSVDFS